MPAAVTRHPLSPHPATPRGAVEQLHVELHRQGRAALRLSWQLRAEPAVLVLPPAAPAVHTDGLWRHTCFEAFIAPAAGDEYWEFNFSPSGAWASYAFSGYRAGMRPLGRAGPPVIETTPGSAGLNVDVVLDLASLSSSSLDGWRLGLCAVIEDRTHGLSYWALRHAAGRPDFHRADSFVVALG